MANNLYFLLFLLLISSCNSTEQIENKPNIVLIIADDMGYECIGVNGSTEYQTPHLDRLAKTGIRFTNCYSQPLCTPSRVKIMTGKYNFRNYEDFGYLNPNEKTFGNLLKEAGYATCIAGKWQLNGLNRNNPGNQDLNRPYHFGFDEYCLWQLHVQGNRYAEPLLTQNGNAVQHDAGKYGPRLVADFITDFIEREADNPFFVYYPMILPHSPFVPTPDSPEWEEPTRRSENDTAYFADMVTYTDKIVGQLEDKLKEMNVWDNTLFIFTADNGTHRSIFSQTDYGIIKGAKGESINYGNHVPMIINWPQNIKEGEIFPGLIDFADFLPTLADAAGIESSSYYTDGNSFLKIMEGKDKRQNKNEIFIHYTPRWGWPSANNQHNRWVMNEKYKLYRDGRFFNTSIDPLEKKPIIRLAEKEQQLKNKFEKILTEKESEFPFDWNNKEFRPQ